MSNSKLNLLVHLNAYEDSNDTNNPSLNNYRWHRDIQAITISESASTSLKLPAGQSLSLFSGTVTTSDDVTTTWDIALKSGSSTSYLISHASGTAPLFKTPRNEGADATTEVTVTKNAKLLKFVSTGGTLFSLLAGGAIIGDEVRIGSQFNSNNQGKFKILALDATSFTVENELGAAEGPVVLGASFAEQVNIYSASGVQIGDKVDLKAGFSSVSFGTYEITDVSHDFIQINSAESLPSELGVSNNPSAFLIYRDAKQFLYIESDKKLSITLNGSATPNELEPFKVGTARKPGIFMSSASIKSASIENKSQETATIFYATAE